MIERTVKNVRMKCVCLEEIPCLESWEREGDLVVELSKEDGGMGAILAWSGEMVRQGAAHHNDIRKRYGDAEAQFHNRFYLYIGNNDEPDGSANISGNEKSFTVSGYIKIRN